MKVAFVVTALGVGFAGLAHSASLMVPQIPAQNTFLVASDPALSAHHFLLNSAKLMRLRANLSDLRLEGVTETPVGYHVRFEQMKAGLPVDHGGLVITLDRNHRVISYVNNYAQATESPDLPARFDLPREKALARVYEYLHLTASPTRLEVKQKVRIIDGQVHPVYQVNLSAPVNKRKSWEVVIDASSGLIHRSVSRIYHASSIPAKVRANVFDPNPTIKSGVAYGSVPGFVDADNADSAFFDSMLTEAEIAVTQVDGKYTLTNEYVTITDYEDPKNPECPNPAGNFLLNRADPCFDAVNAFYFITKSLTYLNDGLGIKVHPIRYSGPLQVDPHGMDGDDESHFDSNQDRISFGEGGVDDAQDHEVVIHELGHAIDSWLTKGHLPQFEGLAEGIADYWSVSYSRTWMKPSHIAYNWINSFDGHNEYWDGRELKFDGKYPDAVRVKDLHEAGTFWTSTCVEIWDAIGKDKMDRIFWSGMAMLTNESNQQDAARALNAAAKALYPKVPVISEIVKQKLRDRGFEVD